MNLEHEPRRLKKPKVCTYIHTGTCCLDLQCKRPAGGDTAGFGGCGRCLFHHGCVESADAQCSACCVRIGTLNTARFETCWLEGCPVRRVSGLCPKCTTAVGATIKRQIDGVDTMSPGNLRAAVARYPGLQNLEPILQDKVVLAVKGLLASDWQYTIERDGSM